MPIVTFGPFAFDSNSRLLRKEGTELFLPPRVLGVLEVLLRRAGEVVPRQELIDSVWKDAFVTDTSLAEAVSVLRQALGDDPQAPSYIQTIHRRGYRFVASVDVPVEEVETVGRSEDRIKPSIAGSLLPWSVAAICAVLAGVAVREAVTDRETGPPPVARFTVAPVHGTRFDARAPALAMSPDASRIAWTACDESTCRLYVRPSDRLEAVALAGTDDAAAPFFSTDGRSIGFFADGHLKKVALAGGAPVTLADAADPLGGAWTRDGQIIYAGAGTGLRTVRDTGGEPITLTTPQSSSGEVRHVWPSLHPAADLLLFTITAAPDAEGGGRLALLRLDTRPSSWKLLIAGIGAAKAASADIVVFSRGAELQAVAFDSRRGGLTGAPQTVLTDVTVSRGAGQFALSTTGALISASGASAERPSFFWWTTADGRNDKSDSNGSQAEHREPALTRELDSLRLSPDGRRVAGVDRSDPSRPDVWIADLERGTSARLTHNGINAAPIWSADGASVFFASSEGGVFAIHRRDADSQRPSQRIHTAADHAVPVSVSPDGALLAFVSRHPTTGADVWGLPLNGGAVQALVRTSFDDIAAAFSPDGRFIAYQSNDAGRWEVYVQRRTDQRRITVSTQGGTQPFWSADGRSLFFRSRDRLMRASVSADGSNISGPEVVMRLGDSVPIEADSKGRLLLQRCSRMPADEAVLTLHWVREARQILGPPSAMMPR